MRRKFGTFFLQIHFFSVYFTNLFCLNKLNFCFFVSCYNHSLKRFFCSQSLRISQVGGRGYANALATDVMTENTCQKFGSHNITRFTLK